MAMQLMQQGQAVAQIFADRMLNSVGEGIAIALFAWMLLRLLSRQSSSTRFGVWFSALLAVVAFPLFEGLPTAHSFSVIGAASTALRLPAAWGADIFAIWAVIAGIGLGKVGFSLFRLRRLRRTCQVLDHGSLHPVLQKSLCEFGSARRVQLCTSADVRVPAALGFVKPAIVLPSWTLEELDPRELNAVLLHELAHLRRWDDWTNLAQEILRALFFFHPAVWFIGRSLSAEREMACDDFVLAGTSDPGGYARCLVSVAEKTFLRRGLALAFAIAGRVHQTTRRVTRILDVNRPTATEVWKPALGLMVTFCAVCLISLPRTPRLVEFESTSPAVVASAANPMPGTSLATSARMIPAAFQVAHSNPAIQRIPSLRDANAALQASPKLPAPGVVHAAKFVPIEPRSPKLANAINRMSPVAVPRSVLVVMQSEQVDNSGNVVWSVAVWRLTVFHPADQTVRKEITPKTT